MRFFTREDENYEFGFEEFDLAISKQAESVCTSGHGHCWNVGPILLSYPPIYTYNCEHCKVTKHVNGKGRNKCHNSQPTEL